ncbi:MAG TPA: DASS family sodium-coupled anion symporter [Gemmatimonadales bacterium]|nr:DASS family sodium-coupled anion symporter [Gemmatimonadales bacterium]
MTALFDPARRRRLLGWAVMLGTGGLILAIPLPEGIDPSAWRLLAIFAMTIVGSIVQPIPAGAIVLIAVCATALTGALTPTQALGGYADPVVWMVLCAFFLSHGIIRTGLGRRFAFLFIRAIGKSTVGLAYALAGTDCILASIIPSNAARAGGVLFPITLSLAEAYESRPGPTAGRLGKYLMTAVYQCDVVNSAMFLTGQASNVIAAKFALDAAGYQLSYAGWILGAIVPGLIALLVLPPFLARVLRPEVRHTPDAAKFAAEELARLGPLSWNERITLVVFLLVAGLWMTATLHHINYAVVALMGVGILVVTGVLDWIELVSDGAAWNIFIWYGGLVRMAEALGESGITRRFAEAAAGLTAGWAWGAALAGLLLIYFYAHYGFASITAHVAAMFTPFLVVILAAGTPPALAVLSLAYFSNLCAALTHYGTTPAPIYFGANYVTQREWWLTGWLISLVTIAIFVVFGFTWWKVLGWW